MDIFCVYCFIFIDPKISLEKTARFKFEIITKSLLHKFPVIYYLFNCVQYY